MTVVTKVTNRERVLDEEVKILREEIRLLRLAHDNKMDSWMSLCRSCTLPTHGPLECPSCGHVLKEEVPETD